MRRDIFTDTDPSALLVDYLRAKLWQVNEEQAKLMKLVDIDRTGSVKGKLDYLDKRAGVILSLIKSASNPLSAILAHRKYLRDNGVIQ